MVTKKLTVSQLRRQREEAAKKLRVERARISKGIKERLRSKQISKSLQKGAENVLKSRLAQAGVKVRPGEITTRKVTSTVNIKGRNVPTTINKPVATFKGVNVELDPTTRSIRVKNTSTVVNDFNKRSLSKNAIENLIKKSDVDVKPSRVGGTLQTFEAPKSLRDILFGDTPLKQKPSELKKTLERKKQKQISKRQKTSTSFPEKAFSGIVISGGIGAVKGLIGIGELILSPVQSAKNLGSFAKQFATNPAKVIKTEVGNFAVDPVGVMAEWFTFSKGLNTIAKTTARTPVARLINEELFIRQQPKALQSSVRSIVKSSKVQEKINPFKVKNINKVDIAEVRSLTKTEAAALKKTLQTTDSVVFGSLASRTLSKKKTPIPKDVDLATANIRKFSQQFIDNLPKSERANYLIKGEKLVRKSNGEALLDIKPLSKLFPDKKLFRKKGFLPVTGYVSKIVRGESSILPRIRKRLGFAPLEIPTQKLVKVEGITLSGFGEQTARKGLGTLQVLLEKNIRRAKDPQSFIISLEIQLEALKKGKPSLLNKRKIKTITDALKVLKSKSFENTLKKTSSNILKEFPILKKIDKAKLSKARKLTRPQLRKIINQRLKKSTKIKRSSKLIRKKTKKKSSKQPSKLKRKSKSKIPSKLRSKLKSKIPSKLRSKTPSKVPKKKISKVPSKVPKKKSSSTPSKTKSRTPSKTKSKTPSKTPSRLLARLRKPVPKKPPRLKRKKKDTGVTKFVEKELKKLPKTQFKPSLTAILLDIKGKMPKNITGLELRPIVQKSILKLKKKDIDKKIKATLNKLKKKKSLKRKAKPKIKKKSKRSTPRRRKK